MSFADKVSISRIILIPIFVSLLIYSRYHPRLEYLAVSVFILAIFSDFFDGLAARIKREKSKLGQVIDPLADKLLLLTAFFSLYLLKFKIPLAVVLVVVSRDLVILLGVVILNILKVEIPLAPSLWGKLTTFFQMATILSVLMEKHISFAPVVWTIAVVFTLISGVDYFLRGVRAINVNSGTARP